MRRLIVPLALGFCACSEYDVTRSQKTDAWTQADRDVDVDILWVLDNSGSMSEEHASLAEHAEAFTGTLSAAGLEFRIGLADTDPADGGLLLGETMDEETSGLTEAFARQVSEAGTSGTRVEEGFATAILAASPLVNTTFARDDADLELVVYSDEDDQSALEVADFLDDLGATHPGHDVHVNTIVGDLPSGCASAVAAADAGVRYGEARDTSGGIRESICTVDMDGVLERMAHRVIGLETEFYLSDLPLLNTLEVAVDGVVVPYRDVDGWRYEGAKNAIAFDGWAIPRPGSKISANYFNWTGGPLPDTGAAE